MLAAAILIALPIAMVFVSLRAGRYVDDSWTALLMATILVFVYLVSRRLLLAVLVAGIVVTMTSWALAPHLATAPNGDPVVLARLDQQAHMGMLAGYHDLAVAQVDLGAAQPVRAAGLGSDATTPMEVGSLTKAMTGLVIADAVHRGELRLDVPVSTYLPQLAGAQAGTVTLGRARHPHRRLRRLRRTHSASRRVEGTSGPELPHRRPHSDDPGDPHM